MRIAEAAEGNPLFVEEMLSMLIDDGLLVRDEGPLGRDRRHLRGPRPADDPGACSPPGSTSSTRTSGR